MLFIAEIYGLRRRNEKPPGVTREKAEQPLGYRFGNDCGLERFLQGDPTSMLAA
ncbi:hypothetical protein [Borborobacter arsenicus]|uniref:hypothetical protein n=1 Tax=Borborobacter arsenicus TaxID=1851146 RepID=UPI001AEC898E|nr:hypothetical protein [Pseudaminobacter arsenicus]